MRGGEGNPTAVDERPILEQWALWISHERPVSENTIRQYRGNLRLLARFGESRGSTIEALSQDDIELFLASKRGQAPGTQNNAFTAMESFYTFLRATGRREDDPVSNLPFKRLQVPKRRKPRGVGQLSQKIAKLPPQHQDLAAFVMELFGSGLTELEIFNIHEEPPVPPEVRVEGARGGVRYIPISREAQQMLNRWDGRPQPKQRAFQRALEKVGLSPKQLRERSRSSIQLELHPVLESTLHLPLASRQFEEAVAKAYAEVHRMLRRLGDAPALEDTAVDNTFIRNLDLTPYLKKTDAQNFKMLLMGALGLFGDAKARDRVVGSDSTRSQEAVIVADLVMHLLEEWVDRQRLRLLESSTAAEFPDVTTAQLRQLHPLAFENWVIQRFQGTHADHDANMMGIDGWSRAGYPIQVKRYDIVNRPDIDRYVHAFERTRRPRGYVVAFGFSKGAYTEANRIRDMGRIDLQLKTVRELLEEVPP